MSSDRLCGCALFVAFAALAGSTAWGQWPTDPSLNLSLADRTSEQVIPLVASTSDGGCYVAWFDLAAGSYDVYLQRLDAAGVEQWAHNGILISDHAQNSALFGWHMIVDSSDHAVLVFSDERSGGDLDIQAYRVDTDGAMVWGANGVTLSFNSDFEPAPRVAEASDGDLVFVWARLPNSGDGDIRMQRLSPAGLPRLAIGGRSVVSVTGEDPGFVEIIPADDGSVILSWVRDISSFFSDRHVRAEKFSDTGASLWAGPVDVFDATSVPIAHTPRIHADGEGGALLVWHRSQSNLFNSFVQHLDADGDEIFPHNGVAISMTPGMHHLDPALTYDKLSGNAIVFWNQRNSSQSQWGIFAQRITPGGGRAWGNAGIELLPVNTVHKSFPRAVPFAGGAMVFFIDQPTGLFGQDRVAGIRIDGDGQTVWSGSQLVVSSLLSGKARLPITIDNDGAVTAVWEDDRNGTVDVFGQRINPEGTLGFALPLPGDVNRDGAVDLTDHAALSDCLAGPNVTPVPTAHEASVCLRAFDQDGDTDIDLTDVAAFVGSFTE